MLVDVGVSFREARPRLVLLPKLACISLSLKYRCSYRSKTGYPGLLPLVFCICSLDGKDFFNCCKGLLYFYYLSTLERNDSERCCCSPPSVTSLVYCCFLSYKDRKLLAAMIMFTIITSMIFCLTLAMLSFYLLY